MSWNLGTVYLCSNIHVFSDFSCCLFYFSCCIVGESVIHLSCMFQMRFERNMSNRKNITKRLQRPVKVLLEDVMPKKSSTDEPETQKQVDETAQGSSADDVAVGSSSMLKSYEEMNKDQDTSSDPNLTGQGREGEGTAAAVTTALPYYLPGNVR